MFRMRSAAVAARSVRFGNMNMNSRVKVPKRGMAGGHAPPPSDGIDGMVRKVLPENWQISLAIMGGYAALFLVVRMTSGGKKPVAEVAHAHSAPAATDSAVPSVESEAFGDWVAGEGNAEKFFDDLENAK